MCGIFGAVDTKKILVDSNILPHRGPDSWDVYYHTFDNVHITLFQSRLSIIGLGDQGKQPYTKDGKVILIYNGEIYNYKELKQELIRDHNCIFATATDTEVLYECYLVYGLEKTLQKLNGIFAFAIYNAFDNTLLLARDQIGVKPVYYYNKENILYFSSEPKVFFELKLIAPILRKELLGEYFANGWIYEPDTLFKDVNKIEAGNYAVFEVASKKFSLYKYWDIQNRCIGRTSVAQAIVRQTVSDVPIGTYFSGGVDSSLIAFALQNHDALNLNLDLGGPESKQVKLFEKKYQIPVSKFTYEASALDIYKKMIYFLDEPMADPAIIPSFILAQESRKNNRIVMLSGMGGDEIDTGYTRSSMLFYRGIIKTIRFLPNFLIFPFLRNKIKRDYTRLVNFARSVQPWNYFSLTSYFSKGEIDCLVGVNWICEYKKKIAAITETFRGIKKFFALDFKGFLTSHNLLYIDKASMAASIEVRVPLLDKDIVQEYFHTIDKRRYAGKKRLKGLLKQYLGGNYVEGNKQGFSYPIKQWIQTDIAWQDIVDFFERNKIIKLNLLHEWVGKISTDYESVAMKLWSIYTLYLWMKQFNVSTTPYRKDSIT